MTDELLSRDELWLWHAWKIAGEQVMVRVTHDIAEATKLSGPDFTVLIRLTDLGRGYMVQQDLADSMRWDKSRLSHHLSRMVQRKLIRRKSGPGKAVTVMVTAEGAKQLAHARPIMAQSVRRNLLWRLNMEQRRALLTMCKLLHDD